jgi:hypothetical protein
MEEAGAAQGPTCVERLSAVKTTAIAQLVAEVMVAATRRRCRGFRPPGLPCLTSHSFGDNAGE